MADIPLLNMKSGSESLESEQKMESPKISVTENATNKSNSFVIEMEAISCASINKDSNSNSRITLQRSVSRKGWSDKKVNVPAAALRDWDAFPALCSSSPTGCYVGGTQEKVVAPVVGPGDNCGGPPVHHQITVTTATEAKSIARRNSFKRPSIKWGLDPKHVFLFCAFLSSIGTILLIYLTCMKNYEMDQKN